MILTSIKQWDPTAKFTKTSMVTTEIVCGVPLERMNLRTYQINTKSEDLQSGVCGSNPHPDPVQGTSKMGFSRKGEQRENNPHQGWQHSSKC